MSMNKSPHQSIPTNLHPPLPSPSPKTPVLTRSRFQHLKGPQNPIPDQPRSLSIPPSMKNSKNQILKTKVPTSLFPTIFSLYTIPPPLHTLAKNALHTPAKKSLTDPSSGGKNISRYQFSTAKKIHSRENKKEMWEMCGRRKGAGVVLGREGEQGDQDMGWGRKGAAG